MEFVLGLWIGAPIGFLLCALLTGAKTAERMSRLSQASDADERPSGSPGIRWPHSRR